jgi:LAO/AO transport system kinase
VLPSPMLLRRPRGACAAAGWRVRWRHDRPTPAAMFTALQAGDRRALGRALTLVESSQVDHRRQADELLTLALQNRRPSFRVGISGPPGAGKSTFIDALGLYLVSLGHRVAVMAVDPSSVRTGGSILGDKTRMERLAQDAAAFVRASPSKGHLGGVTANAYESTILFEAGGYDVVLIETVGVGQSEVAVADLTDCFLLLIPPSSGDELQGIKKGIVEVADILCITKADGDTLPQAQRALTQYTAAIRLLYSHNDVWDRRVLLSSAKDDTSLRQVWEEVLRHRDAMAPLGLFTQKREAQRHKQLWNNVQTELVHRLRTWPGFKGTMARLERQVQHGTLTPRRACYEVLDVLLRPLSKPPEGT